MTSFTRQMAEFATDFRLQSVPEAVVARAKGIVLDGLGCGLFASTLPWIDILAKVIRRLEPQGGQAAIWGRGESASAANATLINGTMIQGYELDDAHSVAGISIHSCAAVLPAAFAAAEYVGAD